jgi:hypothetical protein
VQLSTRSITPPVLGTLISRDQLSRHIADTACIRYLFLFSVFLLRDIWFLTPYLVLRLFHFQSVLSDFPSIATGKYLPSK